MNATEALMLCRFVKGACPQQAIDEYTPDAWLALLEPYRFEDCRDAAVDLARESPFVAPAEIIARVKAIRGKRIQDYGPFDPPTDCPDYHAWLSDMRKRIADGELKPERRAIDAVARERLDRQIEDVFPKVPE